MAKSKEKTTWVIQYEIPPMRAVYFTLVKYYTEEKVREMVKKEHPLWKIRQVSKFTL